MTEITRVPLQPIGKGSLTKLWLGVAAAVLAAGGVAWAAMPPAVHVKTIKAGTGPSPTRTDYVLVNYKGTLPDGKVFDQNERTPINLAQVVPGFIKALEQMQKGGVYRAEIPSELAYGAEGGGPVPPNTDLTFDIELLDFKSAAEVQAQMQMMQQLQQMQQMQQQPGASPHGVPAPGGMPPGAMPQGAVPQGAMPEGVPPPR